MAAARSGPSGSLADIRVHTCTDHDLHALVAVWLAQFASKQITRPIEALVTATGELAGGHLDYRVQTPASDELAGLVSSFNSMSQALEGKTRQLQRSNRELALANREIEERRQFIDAILESITPGVVSVNENGEIVKFNDSARRFTVDRPMSSLRVVTDLLDAPDRPAFQHMFSTARRTGISYRDFEVERRGRPMHLAVTVSSLDPGKAHRGFVVVLEDTTEIMRAQRSEAWQEVARRLAHEIKNPLTPVALAAGRIDRLLERFDTASDPRERDTVRDRLAQSTRTINREVQSLKTLVDSFSDVARFPAIRPEATDLNALVRDAVKVFDGRLPGVRLSVDADPSIPTARIDPEPFKRVIVNLIDNAAEVVQARWVKEIVVSTRSRLEDSVVELAVADSGPGISPENKQKLFVPYFSTKERGTGLGLSIVRSIVQDHHGTIRVEDNHPTGSRFIIEVPTAVGKKAELQEAVA
jgi:PAS domain S-box-containing protein